MHRCHVIFKDILYVDLPNGFLMYQSSPQPFNRLCRVTSRSTQQRREIYPVTTVACWSLNVRSAGRSLGRCSFVRSALVHLFVRSFVWSIFGQLIYSTVRSFLCRVVKSLGRSFETVLDSITSLLTQLEQCLLIQLQSREVLYGSRLVLPKRSILWIHQSLVSH